MHRLQCTFWTAVAILAWAAAPARTQAADLIIDVTVDSSSITNGTAGFADFQFSAGDPAAQTAQVVVQNIVSTSFSYGAIALVNSATGGPLPSNVTIQNDPSNLTNAAKQSVTFGSGSSLSFRLQFSGNALTTPGAADSTFYFSLLDTSNQSIFPGYGLSHLEITLPSSGTGVPTYSNIPQITVTVLPEPGTIVMAAVAAATLLTMRRRPTAG